ncbi:MAG: hypothetical protein FWC64_11980, partial [Treponema sp.]|nr:hypothetical protein [Treponema sp.]
WVTRLHSSLVEQYFDNVRGFRVEYDTPVQGLSVGAAFRAEGQDAEGFGRQMIFGANFFHPMFNAVFAYDLSSDVRTLFGLNFTGIPDLTAGLQLLAMNLATWDEPLNFGTLDLHQIVGYRVARPLFVYLLLGQSFDGNPDNDYVGMSFTPGVEYRVTQNLTASFSLTLESPDRFTTTNLTLNPLLEYTLTGPAMLYVEYELRLDNMDRASHTFGFGVTIRAF